ncbi:MAG: ATPase, partial [Phycisphaerae bacterium]|nr:ATPase [Phycisphaerae bacterium]
DRALHALFQSVTARTAGFNSTPIDVLSMPAVLVLVPLMFVGGSPGSCAGGVKTTSLAVWGARVFARLVGREHVNIGERHIPHDIVRRAALIIVVAALWNAVGVLLLASTETVGDSLVRFEHIIFEQVSAFATVGLSAGLTPSLSVTGKLWIIASMFVGRLGPLTIAFAVMHRPPTPVTYPTERLMVG